jgi:hypothetical protein
MSVAPASQLAPMLELTLKHINIGLLDHHVAVHFLQQGDTGAK